MATAKPAEKKIKTVTNQVTDVQISVPYEVRDHAVYNIPSVCTCCLAPTDNRYNVKWGTSRKYSSGMYRVTESQTAQLDFCVCPDCVAHHEEYNRKKKRMIILSIITSAIISTILGFVLSDVFNALLGDSMVLNIITIVLVPIIIAMPVLAILDILIPQRALDRRHSSRTLGVRMMGPHHFEFDNLVYAQLFEKMNGEGAKFTDMIGKQHDLSYKATKTIKTPSLHYKVFGKSLLESKPLIEIFITTAWVSVGLTFLFSMAIFAMTEPPTAGSPGSYICSGFLLIIVITAVLEEWKKA